MRAICMFSFHGVLRVGRSKAQQTSGTQFDAVAASSVHFPEMGSGECALTDRKLLRSKH